jgi:hypothetical protein
VCSSDLAREAYFEGRKGSDPDFHNMMKVHYKIWFCVDMVEFKVL